MATLIETDPGTTFTDWPTQQVEWSADITNSESWTTIPDLWCYELKLAVNAYDTAKLRYEIGSHVVQPGGSTISDYQPLSLRGKYVRIIIPQDEPLDHIVWYGYVLTDQVRRDGVKAEGGGPTNKFQGECQEFDCVGLEWWLDRKQVESSFVRKNDGASVVEIQRALKFNGGESSTIDMKAAHRGNRSAAKIDDYYAFSDDPTTEIRWSARDMVDYLLHYHTPKDTATARSPCIFFPNDDDFSDTGPLNGFHPTVTTEHQTVFQLLNKIISPQRGLCWWLEFGYDEIIGSAHIRVGSLAREEITLTDGTLPANGSQITLLFDNELDVKSCDITNQGKRNYHRVTCRGARQTATFTVGMPDSTLTKDWKSETEDAYKSAASGDSDYSDLTLAKKKARNDAYRKTDLLARVYSYFRIPKDWDGKTGDGKDAEKHFAIAEISPTGSIIGGLPLTSQGIRLLNRTRLKKGADYHDPTHIVSNAPDGSLEEFVPPFAILQVEKEPALGEAQDPERWQYVEKISETTSRFHAGTAVAPSISTGYHLTMQSQVPGLIVNSSGLQHTMALGSFDATTDVSAVRPEVDFNSLRATVCAEADYYASGSAEVTPLPENVPIEELIIDLGDDYRLDFLAENTIVDLKNGVPVLAGQAAILRDDRKTLRDIANIALQWYREDRQQLTVSFRQLRNLFALGQLITTVGQTATQSTINTVISTITYDFKAGTTTIETMDDTLDIRALRGGGIT